MSDEELNSLKYLQRRVGALEILLSMICDNLTEDQRNAIDKSLDERIEVWKDQEEPEDLFRRAKQRLHSSV